MGQSGSKSKPNTCSIAKKIRTRPLRNEKSAPFPAARFALSTPSGENCTRRTAPGRGAGGIPAVGLRSISGLRRKRRQEPPLRTANRLQRRSARAHQATKVSAPAGAMRRSRRYGSVRRALSGASGGLCPGGDPTSATRRGRISRQTFEVPAPRHQRWASSLQMSSGILRGDPPGRPEAHSEPSL